MRLSLLKNLVRNTHNQLPDHGTESVKQENEDDLEYGIAVKSEPESDSEAVCQELDGYIAGFPIDPGDLDDDLDLECRLNDVRLGKISKPSQKQIGECLNYEKSHSNVDAMSVEECIGQDIDDDQADIDWVVETIDSDSDEDSEYNDHDADLEKEEKALAESSMSHVDQTSRKRKHSTDDLVRDAERGMYESIHLDPKLNMQPVVVVQDIIKQILSGDMID